MADSAFPAQAGMLQEKQTIFRILLYHCTRKAESIWPAWPRQTKKAKKSTQTKAVQKPSRNCSGTKEVL